MRKLEHSPKLLLQQEGVGMRRDVQRERKGEGKVREYRGSDSTNEGGRRPCKLTVIVLN